MVQIGLVEAFPQTGKYRVAPKNWHSFFVRLNFVKYQPIFKIILLPESGEHL